MFLSQPFSGVAQGRVLVSCVSPGAHLHPFFCEGAMAFVKMLSVGEDVFVKVFVCVGKRPCLNFSTFVYFQIIFGRGILLDCVSGKPFEMAGNQDFVEPDLSILPTLLDFNEGFNVDYLLISSSVASNVSLGDTNVAVPGRILGRVCLYRG